jgi:hypothetical protein
MEMGKNDMSPTLHQTPRQIITRLTPKTIPLDFFVPTLLNCYPRVKC